MPCGRDNGGKDLIHSIVLDDRFWFLCVEMICRENV